MHSPVSLIAISFLMFYLQNTHKCIESCDQNDATIEDIRHENMKRYEENLEKGPRKYWGIDKIFEKKTNLRKLKFDKISEKLINWIERENTMFSYYFGSGISYMKTSLQHPYTEIENVCPDKTIRRLKDIPFPKKMEYINRTRDTWLAEQVTELRAEQNPQNRYYKRLMHRYKKWYCLLTSSPTTVNASKWYSRWGKNSGLWVEKLQTSLDNLYSKNQSYYGSREEFYRLVSASISRMQLLSYLTYYLNTNSIGSSARAYPMLDFSDILFEYAPSWYLTEEHINLYNILFFAYQPEFEKINIKFIRAKNRYKEKPENDYDEVVIPYQK